MKKQFKQPVVTFNNPAVYASPDGLQEEDIYMNTESACTVDEMPRDTTEDIDEIQTPSITWSSPPVTVAVCWGILLVIMALRIHFTSVISTELSTSKEVHQHLMLTNKDFTQVKKENQQVKEENQQVKEENQQVKEENQQVKEETSRKENQQVKVENQQLKVENQQLKVENQQLKVENQQVKVENQQVKKENQQVKEENQQVKVENQQVKVENQQVKVEIQQMNTTTSNQTMFWS
ncbi:hypothetical protein D5F01_LYC21507 [Larimichthys crocea]|uniref:Uncharacterized protein n=1 Tax=Larimichthys crocea TaxID=215358 RepID=A0A6G0HP10_LARCR|nr:hypothetical protein D5F01_LYC21507 [Larimichthys crocea]